MSNARPGSKCALVTNHYKLTVRNQGLIHVYSADFGILDEEHHGSAIRSARLAISAIIGDFIRSGNLIFAMQLHEDEAFNIPAAARGQ